MRTAKLMAHDMNKETPPLLERITMGAPLISDGATWTFLQRHGLEPDDCPEALNASRPELIRSMAAAYFDSGSDLVLTNSFGGSRFMLQHYGHGDRVTQFNRMAAEHACAAGGEGRYVVGSMGPTGDFVEPLGQLRRTELAEAYAEQAGALAAGGVDAILIETMRTLEEAETAVRASKHATSLPVFVTMVFERGTNGFQIMTGARTKAVVIALRGAGADAVGANCGIGVEMMVELATELREVTDLPLLIQSNAGIPSIRDAEIVYPESPEYMADRLAPLVEIGVNVLGGCCGTGPDHIRALASRLRT
jgi:5-methyltetrahydrofolate--homocysteine methyltransferase